MSRLEHNHICCHFVDIDRYYTIHMHHHLDWNESTHKYNKDNASKSIETESKLRKRYIVLIMNIILTSDPCRPTNDTFKMYFKRRGPIEAEFISAQSLYGMPPQTSLYSSSSACAIAKTASTESYNIIALMYTFAILMEL